ncbi:epoxide hydrolase N-terminal domain-containing protein [Streptomyces sp. SA15]|uniref:epoxide hydrolase N-terminal domain-containing protein n=1 Tax=Streptomyces sp. SA15 TaxID=934019 RepID=UPI00359C20AC
MRPFRIDIAQADLDDLHDRLRRVRLPDAIPGTEWEMGVPVDYLAELAARSHQPGGPVRPPIA